jgi:hypothetical protein
MANRIKSMAPQESTVNDAQSLFPALSYQRRRGQRLYFSEDGRGIMRYARTELAVIGVLQVVQFGARKRFLRLVAFRRGLSDLLSPSLDAGG